MAFAEHSKETSILRNEKGVALFMVISALTILTILVTEFTYVSQINRKMAYDSLNQARAVQTAKIGFKISLLRLKAYQTLTATVDQNKGVGAAVPRKLLEMIWSFPLTYPFPTLPGMTPFQKDAVKKFLDESGIQGSFKAKIESESRFFNLNTILPQYAAKPTTPNPNPTPDPGNPAPTPNPTPTPAFDPESGRKSLSDFLLGLFQGKAEDDRDFADEYNDFKIDELMDEIVDWADITYEKKFNRDGKFPSKKAPFYSVSELRMLPSMDDTLYDLFSPSLTTSPTPGINVNTLDKRTLKALIPNLTEEEVTEFFKFRDSETDDNRFIAPEDFWKYAKGAFSIFAGSDDRIKDFQAELTKKGIQIVTTESLFKITVEAKVDQSVKTLEAWITLISQRGPGSQSGESGSGGGAGSTDKSGVTGSGRGGANETNRSMRVTFLRIL